MRIYVIRKEESKMQQATHRRLAKLQDKMNFDQSSVVEIQHCCEKIIKKD